jgi:hypothetical protein
MNGELKKMKEIDKKSELILNKKTKRLLDLQDELNACENELKDVKEEIIDFMNKNDISSYDAMYGGDKRFKINKIRSGRVEYNVERIKKKITKDQKSEILEKEVEIVDFDRFVKIMKLKGIKLKDIIDCLDIKEKVNTKKLQNLYEIGGIDLTKINDCYSIKENEYLKVKQMEE